MPTGALNNDFDRMDANAARLETIGQSVVTKLMQYKTRNQNITGPGIGGSAGAASLASAEKITGSGINVHGHYERMVSAVRTSTTRYRAEQERSTANLTNVGG
jgi:hypothetical protein